jgi:peptidoglycan/xylan/chitin deacetylase (PgdA/CDA1 family)
MWTDPLVTRGLPAASVCGAVAFMSWAVRGRSSSVFGPSIWRGDAARKTIALTFDDGPSEGTAELLDVLSRLNVPASFFQIGANVDRLPEIARAVAQAGHLIGNHSYSHPLFCFRSPGFMENDLLRAQETIQQRTGTRPEWYRAPFGVRWFGMRAAQRRLGLKGVMWTTIGYDWNLKTDDVVKRFLPAARGGAIFCLHDGRELRVKPDIGTTVEAVRRLVPRLLDEGYQFETVSRLICPTN